VFLKYCKQNSYNIYFASNTHQDSNGYIKYYEKTMDIRLNKLNIYDVILNQHGFDKIVFLTCGEFLQIHNYFKHVFKKIIVVQHVPRPDDILKQVKTISLTPLVKDMPILLPVHNEPCKNIAMIGTFTHKDFDDIKRLLEYGGIKLHIFTKLKNHYSEELSNYKDLFFVHEGKTITEIIETMQSLKCNKIWICPGDDSFHLKDRLSGSIPLAVNFGFELIIPTTLYKIYEQFIETIHVHKYENTILEVIDKLQFQQKRNTQILDTLFLS
jgi:hypothetical protein